MKTLVMNYLNKNFDGRLMIETNKEFYHFNNNEKAATFIVNLFEEWARYNIEEEFQDPIYLFNYCLQKHSFDDIMTLWYEDKSGDFCIEKPFPL